MTFLSRFSTKERTNNNALLLLLFARLVWMLLVFEFFLVILETLTCLLQLAQTLSLVDVFVLLGGHVYQ
jgi:hypothetical protein